MKGNQLQRQILFFSVINYLGTAIGVVSALFIYPLDYAFTGTVKFVDNIAQLVYPIMVFGASHALIKFYPELSEKRRKELFNYSLISIVAISCVVLAAMVVFNVGTGYEDSLLVYLSFPIALSIAFTDLFRKQAQDMQRLAVPTLFERIIPKVSLPLVFLLLWYGYTNTANALYAYAASYLLILALISVYIFKSYKPGYNYNFKALFGEISRRDYYKYSMFAFAGSVGSLLAFRIDGIVIYNWIGDAANGVFANGATLASTMQIPAVGMFALYAPIISNYLKENKLQLLNVKYKEVARLLFFIGALFYSCIFIGVVDLFSLLPASGRLLLTVPIIYILGFSVVINMATGFNTEIITYSKYYKFNMVAILLLIGVNIFLNFIFINAGYGIAGVAWASFISMTLFNIAKLIFIYVKFGLLPFDRKFGIMLLVFTISGAVIYLLPSFESHLVNLFIKVGASLFVNVVAVYKLRLVYQVNLWIGQALNKLKLKS